MIKSKIDAREEAARLALASGAKDFKKEATVIYEFLVHDLDLPDVDDGTALLEKIQGVLNPISMGYDKAN